MKIGLNFYFFSRLYNLRQTDSGYYICNAGNSVGRTRDYAYLEISPKSGENNPGSDDREREQQEREREQQQREREQQERERENIDQTTTPPPPNPNEQKPLVIINSNFNGEPIEIGSDMKLVCIVNVNTQA